MDVDDFPISIYFDDDAALIMRGDFDTIGEGCANHQGVASDGCVAISLDVEIGQIEADWSGVAFCAEDGAALFVGIHHKFVEGQSVDALGCDPPLVEGQVFGTGRVVGGDVVLHDGVEMMQEELMDFLVLGHGELQRQQGFITNYANLSNGANKNLS